jgi:hypothetical protein
MSKSTKSRKGLTRWVLLLGVLAVLSLASVLVACGGPTPTPQILVVTATYTPKSQVQVVTATFTPTRQELVVTATATPTPEAGSSGDTLPQATPTPTTEAKQAAQPGATSTLVPKLPTIDVGAPLQYFTYAHPSGAFSLDIPEDAEVEDDDNGVFYTYADSLVMVYYTVLDAPLTTDEMELALTGVMDDALVGEGLINDYDNLNIQSNEAGDAIASAFTMTSDSFGEGEGSVVMLQSGQTVFTMILLTPDPNAIEEVWRTATETMLVASMEAEAPVEPEEPAEPTDTPVPPTARPPSLKSYYVVYTGFQGPDVQNYSLWEMNGDGSGNTKIEGAGQSSEPAFSADGRRFAFYHWTDGLYVFNLANETLTRIVDNSEASFPTWAPGGNRLAYANLYGQPWIHIVNADGSGDRQLTPGLRPSWSLNGGFIGYDTCENNKCGIFRINPDGGNKRQLTEDGGGGAAVSPNGKKIAYWSSQDGDFEIYVVNADGSGRNQLTKNKGNDALPAWSPDGKYIYYLSDQNGTGWAVMIMNANGSNQRRIVNTNAGTDPNRGWQYQRITVTNN